MHNKKGVIVGTPNTGSVGVLASFSIRASIFLHRRETAAALVNFCSSDKSNCGEYSFSVYVGSLRASKLFH